MPKISVIIPVYNVEKYLRECLDSIINQTLLDIEIICIDDCSTDNSLQILKEYAQKDRRIKIIEQKENKGQGVARNIAIEQATAEYVMFLDPDDWYEKNACEVFYKKIAQEQAPAVIALYFNKYTEETGSISKNCRYNNITNTEDFFEKNNLNNVTITVSTVWGWIFKKSFLDKHKIRFDTCRIFEDLLFLGKIYIFANKIPIIDKCLYNYRVRNNSTSFTEPKGYKDLIRISKELFLSLSQSDNCKKLMGIYLAGRIRRIFFWFDNYSMLFGKSVSKDFYNEIKQFFIYLNNNIEVQDYKTNFEKNIYKRFKYVLKHNYQYIHLGIVIKKCLKNIFSIKNEYNNLKYKVITVLGIKLKRCQQVRKV